MTLLEIVQDILNDMSGDEVNSILDTPESQQVSSIVKNTYYNIINGKTWPHLKKLTVLDGVGDTAHPNYLRLPTNVNDIEYIKYDCKTTTDTFDKYKDITYLSPVKFMEMITSRHSDETNIITITDFGGAKLYIYNDKSPTYATSFDDNYIVFDAYDSTIESTLQSDKSQIYALVEPEWSMVDDFIPALPTELFSQLVAEAKSTCFVSLKQSANEKEEQKSKRQRYRASARKSRLGEQVVFKSFGRFR